MKAVLLIHLLVICFSGYSQTEGNAKLYGYKEPVVKGALPKQTTDENGNKISSDQTSAFNYFIYLQSEGRVYPVEMWINGVPYSVNLERVNTPVSRKNENNTAEPATLELVPSTTDQVILLKPIPFLADKETEYGRSLSRHNELVVVYRQNGKLRYSRLEKLTDLEEAYMK